MALFFKEPESFGMWMETCGDTYLFGNKPVRTKIVWWKIELILKYTETGDLSTKLGDVLQPGHETIEFGQCLRTTMLVQFDKEQQLDWKPQLLDRWHTTGVQKFVGLVRKCSRTCRYFGRHQVGTGAAG
jgi:hypothetical protein